MNYFTQSDVASSLNHIDYILICRSLVANLAAANHYKKEHLEENWKTVEKADIFYISVCYRNDVTGQIWTQLKIELLNFRVFS